MTVGMFSFLKKDKSADKPQESGGLPPLPPMPETQGIGDLPPIRSDSPPELPPMPTMPGEAPSMPSTPEPVPTDASKMPPLPEPSTVDSQMPPLPQDIQKEDVPPAEPLPPMNSPTLTPLPKAPAEMPQPTVEEETVPVDEHDTPALEEPHPMEGLPPPESLFPKGPIRPKTNNQPVEPSNDESHYFPNQFVDTPSTPKREEEMKKPDFPSAFHLGQEQSEEMTDRPLFVRADLYGEVLVNTDDIKKSLTEADEVLYRTNSLRQEMGKEYQKWHDSMEDIQRKLVLIDQSLFE